MAAVASGAPVPGDRLWASAVEGWVTFGVAALVTAAVGIAARSAEAVNWQALAALAHAQDVLRQETTVNLALIGFVEPPLPSLLYLPLAWLAPGLVTTGGAVWVMGAVIAGLTLRQLNSLAAAMGVSRAARWGLCAIALAGPVYLGMAATGSPDSLYLLWLLGAAWALLRWQREGALRDLIGCSLLLSLAFLTRYDALLPIAVATGVVAYRTLRRGVPWSRVEGTLIAFLLPIAYVAGLWILANWLIIGDPWYFWRMYWRPEAATPGGPGPSWQGVLGALAVFPPTLAAVWWAVWGGAAERPRLAVGAAVMLLSPVAAVLLWPGLFAAWTARAPEANLPLSPISELFVPLLVAGWFLSACAVGDIGPLFQRKSITKEVCLAGSGALLAFGCLFVLPEDGRVYVDPRPAIAGQPLGAADAAPTRRVAARLQQSLQGRGEGTLVVAGWPGYAVTLYAGRVKSKVLLVDTDPPAEPLEEGPPVGLLIRDGQSLERNDALRKRWELAVGAEVARTAGWSLEGWAYYPARRPPGESRL